MKRFGIVLAALAVGYVLGSAAERAPLFAQASGPFGTAGRSSNPRAATNLFLVTTTPETRMEPGKAVAWTREQQAAARSHLQWSPQYRLTGTTRPAAQAGQEPTTGEMHADNTQIYLVTGGSGSVVVEGKVDAANDYLVAPGEHRGGPIVGGRTIKVKVGDMVSIPPNTWHLAYGDPGTPLQYVIIHIHTPLSAP